MKKNRQSKTLEFVERLTKVHGDNYDYSKVEYVNSTTKICIICNEIDPITGEKHGSFLQNPRSHLRGAKCPKCSGNFMDKELFIKRARIIHENNYDYSKVKYVKSNTKVQIICPEHGKFNQTPNSHLSGKGCSKCAHKRLSEKLIHGKEKFIEKAKKVHGNKFDYSKVEYAGSHNEVCIICPEHGEFYQKATNHLSGNGCKKCAYQYSHGKYRLTSFEEFLSQAKEIHGGKYDYSKVEWKNTRTKITIICPIHGEFEQVPQNHIRLKCGCRKCGREIAKSKVNKYSTKYFIKNAKKVHGNKYDYSMTKCFNATDKVEINCLTHGIFKQSAVQHLKGRGCPKCHFDQMAKDRAMGKERFINKAKELFGDKFDYSKVKYVNGQAKVSLICPEHGEFEVTPNSHLSRKSGCPICNESKLERELALILDEQKITYERQKRFKWLGRQSLDFYLPEYKMAIECQGVQHYKPVDFGGKGEKSANQLFEKNKKRDERKLKKCLANNINMTYVIDNEEFLENKYHFDTVAPFSGNVSYKILKISHFKNYIIHLIDTSRLLGLY
jgi:hypothetical protein